MESGEKSTDVVDDTNNNAEEEVSMPTTPLPRSESQLSQSQTSEVDGSRHSSAIRPSSTRSAGSRNASATSFVTVSSAGRRSRTKSSATTPDVPETHQVTFTVTVSAAVPAVYDDDGDKNKSKRVVSDPKPQAFYHIEYYLLPTDVDPNKTDITLFGIAAKIYPEKQDAKVMKTWTEGDKTWIAWAQSHVVNLTSDMLKKLCYHKLVVRIWDTRDKFGPKARFDRPRAFKFPPPKPGEDLDDISGVKTFISRMCKAYTRRLPKDSTERALPQPVVSESKSKGKLADSEFTQNAGLPGTSSHPVSFQDPNDVPCLLLGHPDMEYRIYSKLVELARLESQGLDRRLLKKHLEASRKSPVTDGPIDQSMERKKSPTNQDASKGGDRKSATPVSRARRLPRDKKAEQLAKEAAEYAKKHGICSVHVPVGALFVGQRMCIGRLETPVKSVLDAFVSVSIDKDLLTPELTKQLNPMSIKIKSVKNLPDEPVSYKELREKCHPCTLSYQFLKHEVHETKGKSQDKHLHWDDLNVVLLGTIPKSELIEYLLGPAMDIQIHDRDKLPNASPLKPALFGQDIEDEKINNVGYISGRRTQYNALKDRPSSWDPYGVAKVSMSELMLGQKVINLQIPIHNCSIPDLLGRQTETGRVLGMPGSVDGPSEPPMSPGGYMDSHTMIKVRIEVAVPLTDPQEVAAKPYLPMTYECPFGRIVYVLDQQNRSIAKNLLNLVSKINAKSLGLDNLSPVVLDAALSTYKLSIEQQNRKDLDIITGFQLLDGKSHIFVLEGLREGAVQRVWETMSKPKPGVKVLYNSDLSYGHRLYGALDVDLTRVKLHEPLELIVQQPLLFVRDMVPRSCFLSLTKLDQLISCTDLRSAGRNELFPTSDEVISMSREFGVPLTAEDIIADEERTAVSDAMAMDGKKAKSAIPTNATSRVSRSRMQLKEPLDMSNQRYLLELKSRQKTADTMDYLSDNIRTVMLESRQNKMRKQYQPVQHSAQKVAQNYSTSTFNSTEIAKDIIRQNMDKDTLYTYNEAYHHSATFVPVNVEELKKKEKMTHRKKFISEKDWTFPEVKSLQQCNEHPKKPDASRMNDLKQEWIENLDHRNKLNPTLEERDIYSWIDRKFDMNTWEYPPKHFEPQPEPPISIMLPGQKLQKELDESVQKDIDLWQKRLIVEDPSMHFYRCNPQTEAIKQGQKASNQLSKLENLLRDPPKKHAFAAPIMRTDIPPLRVVHYPSVDTKARAAGIDVEAITSQMNRQAAKLTAFKPGPFEHRSWSMESNRVPAANYDHMENGYFKWPSNPKSLYHNHEHAKPTSRRQINPLKETEYQSTYLFADPDEADASRQRHTVLQVSQAMSG